MMGRKHDQVETARSDSPSTSAPRTLPSDDLIWDEDRRMVRSRGIAELDEQVASVAAEPRRNPTDAITHDELLAARFILQKYQGAASDHALRHILANHEQQRSVVARARAVHSEQARQGATPDALPTLVVAQTVIENLFHPESDEVDFKVAIALVQQLHAAATRGQEPREPVTDADLAGAYEMGWNKARGELAHCRPYAPIGPTHATALRAVADFIRTRSGLPHVFGNKLPPDAPPGVQVTADLEPISRAPEFSPEANKQCGCGSTGNHLCGYWPPAGNL